MLAEAAVLACVAVVADVVSLAGVVLLVGVALLVDIVDAAASPEEGGVARSGAAPMVVDVTL